MTTYTVTTKTGSGAGSWSDAVQQVNTNNVGGNVGDTIVIDS